MSRTSLLFTSPVPPCCIAAGCSPEKENYTGRLRCLFCVASWDLYAFQSPPSILLGCSLTNIKFINDSSQSSSTEKNEEHFTRKDPRGFKKIVGRRPKKERERERERERREKLIIYRSVISLVIKYQKISKYR